MKVRLLILILTSFSTLLSNSQNITSLVGSWKMVSGKSIRNDSTFTRNVDSIEAMKIVTPTHVAVFAKYLPGESLLGAAAGTVKVNGNQYLEHYTFSSIPGMLSQTATFTYKLEGDKWYIDGGTTGMKVIEVWQRIK